MSASRFLAYAAFVTFAFAAASTAGQAASTGDTKCAYAPQSSGGSTSSATGSKYTLTECYVTSIAKQPANADAEPNSVPKQGVGAPKPSTK